MLYDLETKEWVSVIQAYLTTRGAQQKNNVGIGFVETEDILLLFSGVHHFDGQFVHSPHELSRRVHELVWQSHRHQPFIQNTQFCVPS